MVDADLPEGQEPDPLRGCEKHIGLYPGGEATAVFADALSDYDVSKGTIRLPYDRELPADLIARIAMWCRAQYGK